MQTQPADYANALDSAALGGIVEELIERLKRGEPVDSDFLAATYPEAADSLRDILPTIRGLVDLSQADSADVADQALAGAGVAVDRQLGDFRLLRQLGRGGMGIVYEAEQISLGRRVALKILPLAGVLDPRTLQRFKNEAQAAASLDHAHIVDVYGVGCERGVHYYAMRLINGCTLADLIAQFREQAARDPSLLPSTLSPPSWRRDAHASLAPTISLATGSTAASGPARRQRLYNAEMIRAIVKLAMDVAGGLDHAHEQGVLHRDIKPSNLMLDGQGKVWITDFGLAHIEANQSLTITGDLLGTLRYMSPEQALANRVPVDQRSDLYSLGATLYELLTLQPLIAGDDRPALIHHITFAEPPPPRHINPQIPADLETIVLKMLEKDAGSRYWSAAELREDLSRFLHDQPIAAQRPSLARRVMKWSQRHRSLVTTIALASLAAIAGMGAVAGWWAREEAAQRSIREHAVASALVAADHLGEAGQWPEALAELRQARNALGGRRIDPALERRIARQASDAEMAVNLDDVRLLSAALAAGEFDFAAANAAYDVAFRNYGIDLAKVPLAEAAQLVERSGLRKELADALTNWSIVLKRMRSDQRQEWRVPLEIARQSDADPWRNRLRQALESPAAERAEVLAIVQDLPLEDQPPSALFLLLQLLAHQRVSDSTIEARLQEINDRYPGDFWIQFALARHFEEAQPPQWDAAVRHYSVALGIRPSAAAVYKNLGAALKRQGKRPEALARFRQAIELAPDFVMPHANLGFVLTEDGKFAEAVAALKKALAIQNELAVVHRYLGLALCGQGQIDEGVVELELATALEPAAATYQFDLGNAHHSIGGFSKALQAYKQAVQLDPRNARARSNLGALLELIGQRETALTEYRQAVKIDPHYFLGCRNLARCLQRLGRFAEGLEELQRGASLAKGTAEEKTRYQELIGEAQQLISIEAEIPVLLSSDSPTADAQRAVRIARVLYYKRRYAEAVSFFATAIESSASASEEIRYDAACVAVLAACPPTNGAVKVQDSESMRFRQLALCWLNEELQSCRSRLLKGTHADRAATRRSLNQWRIDPDLASVRTDAGLRDRSTVERSAWTTLWSSVDQLANELKSR